MKWCHIKDQLKNYTATMYYRHTYHFFFSFSIKTETKRTEQKKNTLAGLFTWWKTLGETSGAILHLCGPPPSESESDEMSWKTDEKKIKIIYTLNVCIGVYIWLCCHMCKPTKKNMLFILFTRVSILKSVISQENSVHFQTITV